jgi:transglutaminase-like putative cysteine protease
VHRHVEAEAFTNYETALDVLIHLKGDCTEHALLFVALCRAAGLPARRVSGLVYAGPAERSFGMHAWAEVYVGQWVDVDPTLNQFPADATHIRLDVEGDRWFELLTAFDDMRIEQVGAE